MSNYSLAEFGKLSEPATELVKRVSDAITGVAKPWQIDRVAKAEVKAERLKALGKIETDILGYRALQRFFYEEKQKQKNIESITAKAIPQLTKDSKPQNIEKDWLVNFFDKSRLISDGEMQNIWSRILAGEANSPGKFSRRKINFMPSMDKQDALMFTNLCNFGWRIGELTPIVFDSENLIYQDNGVSFDTLQHLNTIGLISFENLTGFSKIVRKKKILITYRKYFTVIEFTKDTDNDLKIGQVLLTNAGQELAAICETKEITGFRDYVIKKFTSSGLKVT